MQYPNYSYQNGNLLMTGVYARDHFGRKSSEGGTLTDKTAFNAAKNYHNPASWTSNVKGSTVPEKGDIIDAYIFMRRVGSNVNNINPSHLMVYLAASTIGNTGNRYFDFELFRSTLDFNAESGTFTNAAPANTGGRNPWVFESNGKIRTAGDMNLTFSFNNATVTDIAIYIWVNYSVLSTINPAKFNFELSSWTGENSKSGYGYIKIKPKVGTLLPAWGAVNSAIMKGPSWGTTSKELAAPEQFNSYSENYAPGQYAEVGIDLTDIGVDEVFSTNFNPCSPAYRRVLIKSRSSESFSSTLEDFVGPFEFLDVPFISPAITATPLIDCRNSNAILKPTNFINSGTYVWSTTSGNLTSRADTAFATANKDAKYYLRATAYGNCSSNIDSVVIKGDFYKPIAKATIQGELITSKDSVLLVGGDKEASRNVNPTATSTGLTWSWTGAENFSSDKQNAYTKTVGEYRLILTEARNGCADTAFVTINNSSRVALPITFKSFSITNDKSTQKSLLKWQVEVEDENLLQFEVQKSSDGKSFKTIAYVLSSSNIDAYMYRDALSNTKQYYRIKAVGNKNTVYSRVILVGMTEGGEPKVFADGINKQLMVQYAAKEREELQVDFYHISGQKILSVKKIAEAGTNNFQIPFSANINTGIYLVQVNDTQNRWGYKVVF